MILSPQHLRSESGKVCGATRGGMACPAATNMVSRDLVVPVAVAGDIVATPVVTLGC